MPGKLIILAAGSVAGGAIAWLGGVPAGIVVPTLIGSLGTLVSVAAFDRLNHP